MSELGPAQRRRERIERLRGGRFDLLVLGGGVTGAGIARDAALRGLSVALVDKQDLASGTSSASSKLIHGGLRYLEQYELGLVMEGTRERATLMKLAPHLARPLPFLFPVYRSSRVGMLTIAAGMWAYDLLALFRNYKRHRMLSRSRTERAEPGLLAEGLKGAALYYDCMTDDARLALETALDAERHGAVVATYVEAVDLLRDATGKTKGLRVRDMIGAGGEPGEPFEVGARMTAVAAGPWTDDLLGERVGRKLLRPTKGSHIVVDRQRLPIDHAVVLTGPTDGRVMFAIPWGRRTIVGTTDTDEVESPDGIEASAADVDYLLEAANAFFPDFKGQRSDVISTWSGLRPLMADPESESASDVSREHEILDIDPGLLAIAGGKLTTYRLMSEQVVDKALAKLGGGVKSEPCRTEELPLPGAHDLNALADLGRAAAALAEERGLEADLARHLIRTYGLRAGEVLDVGEAHGVGAERLVPDLPYLAAELAYAVSEEMALRLEDVLRRRTLLFLQDREQGLGVAERAAEVAASLLGWSAARQRAEVERYAARVAASRRFREAPAQAREGVKA